MAAPAGFGVNLKDAINRESPTSRRAKTGDVMYELIASVNALNAVVKALVAKLNLDAGVTDANYSSAALAADVKKPEDR